MVSRTPTPAQLAGMLESISPPDDSFASHDDAMRAAWQLLSLAHHGDTAARFLIRQTVANAEGKGEAL